MAKILWSTWLQVLHIQESKLEPHSPDLLDHGTFPISALSQKPLACSAATEVATAIVKQFNLTVYQWVKAPTPKKKNHTFLSVQNGIVYPSCEGFALARQIHR